MSNVVLLVEDDRDDALLMQHAWSKSNMDAPLLIVTSGEEAICYLQGAGLFGDRGHFPLPCLVLLDLQLPQKSGFEVLQWIRRDPSVLHVVVAILSSSRQRADVVRAYELGANSFLVKPSTLSDLFQLVQDMRAYWFRWNVFASEACGKAQANAI